MSVKEAPHIEYKSIEVLSFCFNSADMNDHKGELETTMRIETKNADEDDVVLSKIDILVSDKESEKEFLKLSISNIFNISNLKEHLVEVEGKTIVDKELVLLVGELVISTARGIFWEKTRGTFLQSVILPTAKEYLQ